MATATAGWVTGIVGGVQGGIADGWHHGGFGLSRGAVRFGFAYMILHIPSFHKYDIVRLVLGEILHT
jgi:hypothetical protein